MLSHHVVIIYDKYVYLCVLLCGNMAIWKVAVRINISLLNSFPISSQSESMYQTSRICNASQKTEAAQGIVHICLSLTRWNESFIIDKTVKWKVISLKYVTNVEKECCVPEVYLLPKLKLAF